jgi:hypothetical protein
VWESNKVLDSPLEAFSTIKWRVVLNIRKSTIIDVNCMVEAKADWHRTRYMENRLAREGKLEIRDGKNYYEGRPIIHKDSHINGGVYLGTSQREAIVVDIEKSLRLRKLYINATIAASIGGVIQKNKILQVVYDTVANAMPKQDDTAVMDIIKKYGKEKDGEINLDVFIKEGAGVCRQDALACAALLEEFKRNGHIRGAISVDRNTLAFVGGHAWCRYTTFEVGCPIIPLKPKGL